MDLGVRHQPQLHWGSDFVAEMEIDHPILPPTKRPAGWKKSRRGHPDVVKGFERINSHKTRLQNDEKAWLISSLPWSYAEAVRNPNNKQPKHPVAKGTDINHEGAVDGFSESDQEFASKKENSQKDERVNQDEDLESPLNPNAIEFIPGSTSSEKDEMTASVTTATSDDDNNDDLLQSDNESKQNVDVPSSVINNGEDDNKNTINGIQKISDELESQSHESNPSQANLVETDCVDLDTNHSESMMTSTNEQISDAEDDDSGDHHMAVKDMSNCENGNSFGDHNCKQGEIIEENMSSVVEELNFEELIKRKNDYSENHFKKDNDTIIEQTAITSNFESTYSEVPDCDLRKDLTNGESKQTVDEVNHEDKINDNIEKSTLSHNENFECEFTVQDVVADENSIHVNGIHNSEDQENCEKFNNTNADSLVGSVEKINADKIEMKENFFSEETVEKQELVECEMNPIYSESTEEIHENITTKNEHVDRVANNDEDKENIEFTVNDCPSQLKESQSDFTNVNDPLESANGYKLIDNEVTDVMTTSMYESHDNDSSFEMVNYNSDLNESNQLDDARSEDELLEGNRKQDISSAMSDSYKQEEPESSQEMELDIENEFSEETFIEKSSYSNLEMVEDQSLKMIPEMDEPHLSGDDHDGHAVEHLEVVEDESIFKQDTEATQIVEEVSSDQSQPQESLLSEILSDLKTKETIIGQSCIENMSECEKSHSTDSVLNKVENTEPDFTAEHHYQEHSGDIDSELNDEVSLDKTPEGVSKCEEDVMDKNEVDENAPAVTSECHMEEATDSHLEISSACTNSDVAQVMPLETTSEANELEYEDLNAEKSNEVTTEECVDTTSYSNEKVLIEEFDVETISEPNRYELIVERDHEKTHGVSEFGIADDYNIERTAEVTIEPDFADDINIERATEVTNESGFADDNNIDRTTVFTNESGFADYNNVEITADVTNAPGLDKVSNIETLVEVINEHGADKDSISEKSVEVINEDGFDDGSIGERISEMNVPGFDEDCNINRMPEFNEPGFTEDCNTKIISEVNEIGFNEDFDKDRTLESNDTETVGEVDFEKVTEAESIREIETEIAVEDTESKLAELNELDVTSETNEEELVGRLDLEVTLADVQSNHETSAINDSKLPEEIAIEKVPEPSQSDKISSVASDEKETDEAISTENTVKQDEPQLSQEFSDEKTAEANESDLSEGSSVDKTPEIHEAELTSETAQDLLTETEEQTYVNSDVPATQLTEQTSSEIIHESNFQENSLLKDVTTDTEAIHKLTTAQNKVEESSEIAVQDEAVLTSSENDLNENSQNEEICVTEKFAEDRTTPVDESSDKVEIATTVLSAAAVATVAAGAVVATSNLLKDTEPALVTDDKTEFKQESIMDNSINEKSNNASPLKASSAKPSSPIKSKTPVGSKTLSTTTSKTKSSLTDVKTSTPLSAKGTVSKSISKPSTPTAAKSASTSKTLMKSAASPTKTAGATKAVPAKVASTATKSPVMSKPAIAATKTSSTPAKVAPSAKSASPAVTKTVAAPPTSKSPAPAKPSAAATKSTTLAKPGTPTNKSSSSAAKSTLTKPSPTAAKNSISNTKPSAGSPKPLAAKPGTPPSKATARPASAKTMVNGLKTPDKISSSAMKTAGTKTPTSKPTTPPTKPSMPAKLSTTLKASPTLKKDSAVPKNPAVSTTGSRPSSVNENGNAPKTNGLKTAEGVNKAILQKTGAATKAPIKSATTANKVTAATTKKTLTAVKKSAPTADKNAKNSVKPVEKPAPIKKIMTTDRVENELVTSTTEDLPINKSQIDELAPQIIV